MPTPLTIRARIYDKGYTLAALAAHCNVSPTLVSRVFSGDATSKPFVIRAADALGIPPDELEKLINHARAA